MELKRKIGIVGGGAAGMTAAISAARSGAEVTILEGNDRLGKKILSTGNGKCNLGNMDLSVEQYNTDSPDILQGFLGKFGTNETIDFFRSLGLLVKEKNGYLYPLSEQASSVLDALRYEISRLKNIRVMYETRIERIEPDDSKQCIRLFGKGQEYVFDRVILACGGKAAGRTGSDGSGYRLAEMLKHSLNPVVPGLVQLRCTENWFKSVAGVRAEARISWEFSEPERGELQLTDYGISGIPVFQLSRHAGYLLRRTDLVSLKIDFMPDYEKDDFPERMIRERLPIEKCSSVEEYFTGMLNKKLMNLFIHLAGMKPSDEVRRMPESKIKQVYKLCRGLTVHINKCNPFENAQVCAGGVSLRQITDRLESKNAPGVYFAGELLDVDGRCGGYNLQWAWCSGYLAGAAAACLEV